MPTETLRVAHVITQLELGGAQRNTLYTVTHLDPARFRPTLISGQGGILDPEAQSTSVSVSFISSLVRPIRPWKDISALIVLYHEFRRQKPHIVHTHSSKAGILGRLAAYIAGVPVIVHTFHGFGFTPDQSRRVRSLFIALEKLCARLSTHLIFVAEENRRQAQEMKIGPGVPTSLIRSGIEQATHADATLRQELQIPAEAWVVSSVGNFKPQKNPLDLARTAAAVLEKDPTIHFVFVGDGEQRAKVEKWASGQLHAAHMHFLGWRQDIPNILAASNAYLLTSRWEGLPRSIIEAFSAKLPVVAYAVDGVKEVVQEGKSGFLIPPGEVMQAAEQVLWLKNHPQEAIAMGREGQKRIQTEFDIDLMVRQQEALYEKLYQDVPLKEYYEKSWTVNPS